MDTESRRRLFWLGITRRTPRSIKESELGLSFSIYVTSGHAAEFLSSSTTHDEFAIQEYENPGAFIEDAIISGNLPAITRKAFEDFKRLNPKNDQIRLLQSLTEKSHADLSSPYCVRIRDFLIWCNSNAIPLEDEDRYLFNPALPNWPTWLKMPSWSMSEAIWLCCDCEPESLDKSREHDSPLPDESDFSAVVKAGEAWLTPEGGSEGLVCPRKLADYMLERKLRPPQAMSLYFKGQDRPASDKVSSPKKLASASSSNKRKEGDAESHVLGGAWRDYTMEMKDGEELLVTKNGSKFSLSPSDLGLIDRRNDKPTIQWKTLELFAESNGTVDKSSISDYKWEKFVKSKQILSKSLRAHFEITEDPFRPMQERPGVRTSKNHGFEAVFRIYKNRF